MIVSDDHELNGGYQEPMERVLWRKRQRFLATAESNVVGDQTYRVSPTRGSKLIFRIWSVPVLGSKDHMHMETLSQTPGGHSG